MADQITLTPPALIPDTPREEKIRHLVGAPPRRRAQRRLAISDGEKVRGRLVHAGGDGEVMIEEAAMDANEKKRKRRPTCACGGVLTPGGACPFGCDKHRKPHVRREAEDRALRRRERAAERPVPQFRGGL